MWETTADYHRVRNNVLLATAGNAYGPQFGPAYPPSYDYEPERFACGCSSEDTDGVDCGHAGINYPAEEYPEREITEIDVVWADV